MAKKSDPEVPGTDTVPGADNNAAAAGEIMPVRGGSFIRNEDGSLKQTEGHGFADDATHNQE